MNIEIPLTPAGGETRRALRQLRSSEHECSAHSVFDLSKIDQKRRSLPARRVPCQVFGSHLGHQVSVDLGLTLNSHCSASSFVSALHNILFQDRAVVCKVGGIVWQSGAVTAAWFEPLSRL